jgi:nitrate/nitrite transport system ATP-binding protein
MTPMLAFRGLTKVYPAPTGEFVVMRDFDLAIGEGEFVCLVGHSGCGKSTVLSIAAGLTSPTRGRVEVNGAPISGPGLDRGVVFQAPCLLPWLTACDNVRLAVDQARPHLAKDDRTTVALRYLERVGLGAAADRKPAEISAGMQQRVGIARAFALAPRVLLLDEPFGMLDSITRLELQEALLELWSREQTTALMVTHDVDEALFVADRIALMTSGPDARLGAVLEVPFARPRDRRTVMEHPLFYELRERIMSFLEEHGTPAGPMATHGLKPVGYEEVECAPSPS